MRVHATNGRRQARLAVASLDELAGTSRRLQPGKPSEMQTILRASGLKQ